MAERQTQPVGNNGGSSRRAIGFRIAEAPCCFIPGKSTANSENRLLTMLEVQRPNGSPDLPSSGACWPQTLKASAQAVLPREACRYQGYRPRVSASRLSQVELAVRSGSSQEDDQPPRTRWARPLS